MRTIEEIKTKQAQVRASIQAQMMRKQASSQCEETKNLQLIVEEDEWFESPRDWCPTLSMCLAHRRYALPNESGIDPARYGSFKEAESALYKAHSIVHCTPVYMLDHSALALSISPFSCGFDSGVVGWVFTEDTYMPERQFLELAKLELQELEDYLNGTGMYRYIIKDANTGEVLDSCGGMHGYDYCLEEGEATLKRFLTV